jgi:DNA polymerase/3'-5' exonuclease PolX
MSDKPKFPRREAIDVAREVLKYLSPFCERVVVAGSLRRMCDAVGDVEILFIPKLTQEPDGLFDTKTVDQTEKVFENMLAPGLGECYPIITKRLNALGNVAAWGPLNKLARHDSGIPVDFFSTTAENWWVSLVIRTGSKECNLRLTTGANRLNRTLHAYGSGITDRKTGEQLIATSEEEVFALCGVEFLLPAQR